MVETRQEKRQKAKVAKKVAKVKELKKNQDGYRAGPLVLGFFLFVVAGSTIFQLVGTLTNTGSG